MLMPDKYFDDQLDNEEVLYVFRKHPIVMRKGLIIGVFGPLLGTLPATFRPELGFGWFIGGMIAGIVLGIIVFIPSWISWYFTTCVVTDQRFIQFVQKGIFHRTVSDLGLEHIQSMNYSIAGFEETLFKFGTITMQTYMGDIKIHHIHHPARTSKRIQTILREQGIESKAYGKEVKEESYEEKSPETS